MFRTVKELIELAELKNATIADIMIEREMTLYELSYDDVFARMESQLVVMEEAITRGLEGVRSVTGLTGGDAVKINTYLAEHEPLSGPVLLDAVSKAVATNEVNAAMGKVCATPTAGSAGCVPGVLFAVKDRLKASREDMVKFLFTTGAFGLIVANNAFISGAQGGCQAEVGSASAMAAAAVVEMAGGSPKQSAHAFSITLKNMLGLICDPVAGLVEVPCVKRNALGASQAIVSADMALAGVESIIPTDEVISAMYRVGQRMPVAFKETAEGGLAATPTGKRLAREIFSNQTAK